MDPPAQTAVDELRAAVLRAPRRARRRAEGAADAGAPEGRRARRLRDERGDAAGRRAEGPAARDRRAARRRAVADELGDDLARAEVAGPGFLNLFLSRRLVRPLAAGDARGRRRLRRRQRRPQRRRAHQRRVRLAPTRPARCTSAHSRNAAYGDALARMLAFVGHDVHREYYVNDFGSQVAQPRPVDPGAGAAARRSPRTATRATYVTDVADRDPGCGDADAGGRSRGAASTILIGQARDVAATRFGVDVRHLVQRARPARGLAVAGPARLRRAGRARPDLPLRGRAVAADDGVRRRQGPRPASAPTASTPTSRRTSPTRSTSASAASTSS